MCREPGWNDTLHSARHADPSDSGVRSRDSSQRSVLVRRGLPDIHFEPPRDNSRMVARLDRKRLEQEVSQRSGSMRGVFDKQTRRKPLVFAADAVRYGI
jgi:hypothetical protein